MRSAGLAACHFGQPARHLGTTLSAALATSQLRHPFGPGGVQPARVSAGVGSACWRSPPAGSPPGGGAPACSLPGAQAPCSAPAWPPATPSAPSGRGRPAGSGQVQALSALILAKAHVAGPSHCSRSWRSCPLPARAANLVLQCRIKPLHEALAAAPVLLAGLGLKRGISCQAGSGLGAPRPRTLRALRQPVGRPRAAVLEQAWRIQAANLASHAPRGHETVGVCARHPGASDRPRSRPATAPGRCAVRSRGWCTKPSPREEPPGREPRVSSASCWLPPHGERKPRVSSASCWLPLPRILPAGSARAERLRPGPWRPATSWDSVHSSPS